MATNVTVSVLGSTPKTMAAGTVKEAREALGLSANYAATVNGVPAKDDQALAEYSFVTFAEAVKGGVK